jgi:predicted XRE-type DNA-binding protein
MDNWVDVKGYEKYYMISDKGNVYSKRYKRNMKPQKSGKNSEGYIQIGLTNEDGRKLVCLHKLLMEHFIPNPNNHPCGNHIDGNKQNNDLNNLEWCTLSENQKHAFKTGLNKAKVGNEVHTSKLNDDIVRQIRNLYDTNRYSQTTLANLFGVNQTNIGFIVRRETWKHVK